MDVIKRAVDGEGDKSRTGGVQHAVVIGAGYIGLEMAENLHERGVERRGRRDGGPDHAAAGPRDDARDGELHRGARRDAAPGHRRRGVPASSRTAARRSSSKNTTFIETDLVIMAAGVRPSAELAEAAGLSWARAAASRSTSTCARPIPSSGPPATPSRSSTRVLPDSGSPAGRAGQPPGPRCRGEHLRARDHVRSSRRAPRSSRSSRWSPAAPVPRRSSSPRAGIALPHGLDPPARPRGLLPGHLDDARQAALLTDRRHASSARRSPGSTASTSGSTCSPPRSGPA